MKINIRTKIKPSILSRTPPWPGKILLTSLIFNFLFKYEMYKSPNWQIIEIVKPVIKNLTLKKFIKISEIKNFCVISIMGIAVKQNIIEPIAPA